AASPGAGGTFALKATGGACALGGVGIAGIRCICIPLPGSPGLPGTGGVLVLSALPPGIPGMPGIAGASLAGTAPLSQSAPRGKVVFEVPSTGPGTPAISEPELLVVTAGP